MSCLHHLPFLSYQGKINRMCVCIDGGGGGVNLPPPPSRVDRITYRMSNLQKQIIYQLKTFPSPGSFQYENWVARLFIAKFMSIYKYISPLFVDLHV